MTRISILAVTAAAIAAAFGLTPDAVSRNDASTIEGLQNRLLELKDQANNIQARADAEQRDLTEDESTEVGKIFNAFEATEADIERRQRLGDINNKMAAPAGRKTNVEVVEDATTAAQVQASAKPRVFAQPRSQDTGKWGFRSSGEFMNAVLKGSSKGASVDPRLIANAAPGTYGSEGVGQDGGFAVPPDFRTAIMQKVLGEESLLSLTDQQTSASNTITFPADETTPWQSSGGIQAY